jgi:hypothetical protein
MAEQAELDVERAEYADAHDGTDYLVAPEDKNVLKNLSKMGEELKRLKIKMVEAETVYDAAKKEYEYYANTVLPMEMYNAGVSRVDLLDGGVMTYERKYFCTPNKNEVDKKLMADWLREHGGDSLVKERAAVDGSKIDELRKAGIPFTEICDFNTNSLKAFLKSQIGAAGGVAQIQLEDIPACMHFQEAGIVTIDV